MRKRRLFWHLFPAFLLVVIVSLVALIVYSTEALHSFYLDRVSSDLETRARLVEHRLPETPEDCAGQISVLCRELGRLSATRLTVILPDGTVIGDSEEDPAGMENHGDRIEVREALAGRRGSSVRFSNTLKENMMYVAVPIQRNGRIAGILRTSISVAFIDQALENVRHDVILGGIIVAVLAILLSFYLSRRISRPLEQMKEGAERFAEGRFEEKLLVPRPVELGGLADAMNEMAAQLHERISTMSRQRNEMEAMLSSMVEGVLAVDTEDLIISINRAAAEMFGVDPEGVLSRRLPEAIRNLPLLQFVPKALTCEDTCEEDIIVLGEGERHLQAHGVALYGARKERLGALVVLNDITRLSRLEKVRRDFVANVSHELKTPVTALKGAAETLKEGAISNPRDAKRFLDVLLRQADRMNAIIVDLLLLSRMEQEGEEGSLDLQDLPLRAVLNAAVQACSHSAGQKDISLSLTCHETLSARMDPPLLEQAVVNLIDNAVKYSEPEVTVRIRGTCAEDTVLIEVEDEGMGIDAPHLDRLFERFYRVDKARSRKMGGTGLGLAIVKHIAQAHGGSVEVRSTPGAGSTFTIRIPVQACQDSASIPKP